MTPSTAGPSESDRPGSPNGVGAEHPARRVPRDSAVGRLGRVVVTVPDPQATADFLATGLGFEVIEQAGHLVAVCEGDYRSANGQGALELVPGSGHRVERVIFTVPDGADLDELAVALGARRDSDTTVVLDEPTGHTVAFTHESSLNVPRPPGSVLRPRRMGHVNLKSPQPTVTANFFIEALGLRLSEFIGDDLFWMRTHAEHHTVALRPGEPALAHHFGMEVSGWHSYQPILDHLATHGYKVEYGPGRHTPGRSLFVYVCDPASGLRIELFADMVHITDPDAPPAGWQPGDRLTTTLNAWGPTPPESFLA